MGMYQLTEETVPQNIIDEYLPKELILREKLIRKINEFYQWDPDTFCKAKSGDYSFIKKLLERHLFDNC